MSKHIISLRKSGDNVEILRDGKRISTVAAGSAESLAKQEGGKFIGFDEFVPEKEVTIPKDAETTSPEVASSSSIRKDITDRGEDASKISFDSEKSFETFKERVQPEGGAPTRPETRVSQFERLQSEAGIEGIDEELETNRAEQEALVAGFEKFKKAEAEGQTKGFALGRISEEQQNVQERIDFLQRRETVLTNRLNTKNKAIETVMGLTDKDFEEARKDYQFEFNKNLAVQSGFRLEESAQMTHDRAAFNTLTNIFANSGKKFEDLTDAQQSTINELELRIGLPAGTFEALATSKPKANVIQSGKSNDAQGNEFAWMIIENEDGTPEVIRTFTGGFKKPTGGDKDKDFDTARKFLEDNKDQPFAKVKAGLLEQEELNLNVTDVNTLLDEAGRSDKEVVFNAEQMQSIATGLLKGSASFKLNLTEEKAKAIAQVRKGFIIVKGKKVTLTPSQQDQIIALINKEKIQKRGALRFGK